MQRRTRHDDELVELPAVAEVLERQRHLLPAGLLLACYCQSWVQGQGQGFSDATAWGYGNGFA